MTWLAVLLACGVPVEIPDAAGPASSDPIVAQMRAHPIEITHHGECRMACRQISRDEVRAILMKDGVLDPARTRNDGECPSHALEGRTADGQDVRIVFAACRDETRLVTAIDLGREWPCDCD